MGMKGDASPIAPPSGPSGGLLTDVMSIPCPSTPNPTPPTPAPTPTYYGNTPPTMRSLSAPKYFSTDPSPPPPLSDTPAKDIVIPLPRVAIASAPASAGVSGGAFSSDLPCPSSSSSATAIHFLSSGESDSTLPSDRESSPPRLGKAPL